MKNSCFKKALSLLLAALMLLAAMPVVSLAADDDPPPTAATPTDATPSDASAEVYEAADYDDAVRYVRDRLLARETVIRVACPDPSFETTCQESIFAYDSKSPFTGDYLKNSLERTSESTSERTLDIYPMTDGSYQFFVSYQDGCRPEEEAAVSAAVAAILAELSLDGNSPYEKALAIYTWLCEHVRPLAPSEAQEVHHSAYAALVPDADGRRAAVCQGFSAAFYALALSAGLEARMIFGYHAGSNEQMTAHAWNIVQLDGLWYYLDAFAGAWYGKDAVSPGREDGMNAYFCKPLKDGYGGYTITYVDAYTASEIADYPYDERKDSSYNIVTGSCGADVTYTLNLVDRSLVISGTGDMRDYSVGDIPAIDPDELENASGFPAVPEGWVLPPWFFYECPVQSLVVSEGVTGVGDYAFLLMLSLKEVTLPASLKTIGVAAFLFDPGLERLVIPENVTRIGTLAFCGCVLLRSLTICNNACVVDDQDNVSGENIEEEKLTIPSAVELYCPSQTAGVIKYAEKYHLTYHYDSDGNNRCDICQKWLSECGDTLFWQFDEATGALTIIGSGPMYNFADHTAPWYPLRDKIQSVVFEDASETKRIRSIGNYAFSGCSALEQFTIPDGITLLGKSVWKDTPLTELTIPATVTSFASEGCLQGSNISSVIFEKSTGNTIRTFVPAHACSYASLLTEVTIPDVRAIYYSAFEECNALSIISLPQGLQSIDGRAFYGCTSLPEITLPEGISIICHSTFQGCSSLSKIALPESLERIDQSAFSGCTSLSEITLPENLEQIGHWAFSGCTSLSEIILPNSLEKIANRAFSGCTSLSEITLPKNLVEIGHEAFIRCTSLSEITLPESLERIDYGAFYECTSLSEITLLKNIVEIGDYAFYGCTSLSEITLPESLERIGSYAFCRCSSLSKITLPKNIVEIGDRAFCDCISLSEIVRSESLERIGSYVFCRCSSLSKITLPKNIVEIGDRAFCDCIALSEITLPESVKQIGEMAFSGCTSLSEITLSKSLERIDQNAFSGCTSLSEITFPIYLVEISDNAFRRCTSLSAITLPEGLQSIGSYAFAFCTVLSSIYFRGMNASFADKVLDYLTRPVFHCSPGSTAEAYAQEKGITAHTDLSTLRENVQEATCVVVGSYDEVIVCDVCKQELYRTQKNIPLTDHVDENHDNVCDVCGEEGFCRHDYQPSRIEPTCTEKGADIMTCSNCGYSYSASEIPATGHDFSIAVDEIPATCTESGVAAGLKCSACGTVTGCAEIPAPGHQMEVTSPRKPASCTEPGQTVTLTCSVCGYTEGGEELPALGHLDGDKDGVCDECGKQLEETDPIRRAFQWFIEFFFGTSISTKVAGAAAAVRRFFDIVSRLVAMIRKM